MKKRSWKGSIGQERYGKRCAIFTELHEKLLAFSDGLPLFGHGMSDAPGSNLADVCVTHRYVTKYEVPNSDNAALRRAKSIDMALYTDTLNKEEFDSSDPCLRLAKARLSTWFAGFKPSFVFRAPNGASARSTGKEVNFFVKLNDIRNWEVSPSNLTYAFNIVWNNHALKRCVKHIIRREIPNYVELSDLLRAEEGPNGYRIMFRLFRSLCTFNSVSRLTVVPKNNTYDRPITCVPLWDMVCQLSYMTDIRTHMKSRWGYDLETRADLHKIQVRDPTRATIDLSTASDLVSNKLVRLIWPDHMQENLSKLRVSVVSYEKYDEEQYHHLAMFSPMGCGITFDVMTFTILAILRTDPSASVFGDDIIVSKTFADEALRRLRLVGLKPNLEKSFIEGRFRESCGALYDDSIGYIVSFDFRYPTDQHTSLVLINKLRRIIDAGQVSYELQGILLQAWCELISTIPSVVIGPYSSDQLDEGINGVAVLPSATQLIPTLTLDWQRPCYSYNRYHKRSLLTAHSIPEILRYAMFLYSGNEVITRRETVTVVRKCEVTTGLLYHSKRLADRHNACPIT